LLSPFPLARQFQATTFVAALYQGDIALFLHRLTASITPAIGHADVACLLVYWLTAPITPAIGHADVLCLLIDRLAAPIASTVSQYDGILFHSRGFTVIPTTVGEERRHPE
jgi:hypothetical protein